MGPLKLLRSFGPSSTQFTDRRTGLRFLVFKHKEAYIRLFQQVKSWLSDFSATWDFESYLSDYESGAYLAVKEVFPGIGEEGCFFHMCKRLDYHIKQLGLLPKYTSDLEFKVRVKKLAALAFVPLSDVVLVYESLSTSFLPGDKKSGGKKSHTQINFITY